MAWRTAVRKLPSPPPGSFSDLAEGDLMGLHLHIEDLEFPAGTIIYHSDEPGRALFTIRSGVVKLVQCLPNGTQRIVRLLRQGATLGLEAVLGEPYRHAAITMQDALICRIPATAIHQLNVQSPALYTQLMRRWQQSVEQADEWLTFLSTGTARARVARLFCTSMATRATLYASCSAEKMLPRFLALPVKPPVE